MSFLKQLFTNVFAHGLPSSGRSSFEGVTERDLESHLSRYQYDGHRLTNAIRPAYNPEIMPISGYRTDIYHDANTRIDMPVLMAAASRETLIGLFFELMRPLGSNVDVVLESSHDRNSKNKKNAKNTNGHSDLYREEIDMAILQSTICEYEDLVLHDGCFGIAVLNSKIPMEVQLDEHKLLIAYGADLSDFEDILQENGIPRNQQIRFITEGEHIHNSPPQYRKMFEELKYTLGVDDELMELPGGYVDSDRDEDDDDRFGLSGSCW